MDKDILKLTKEGKTKDIKLLLDTKDDIHILDCVSNSILKGSSDCLPLIQCIITASETEDEASIELCAKIYTCIMKILQKNEINSKAAFRIISVLLTELDSLQPKCLCDLANFFVTSVKDGSYNGGKVAELLPNILSLINACDNVPHGEGYTTGPGLKSHIINSLCSSRWSPSIAVSMSTLFHDIPLTLEELKFVIGKIIRLLHELDLADQPAVVFQLLLLSAKGHKKFVLEGIMEHFTALDDANRGKSIMMDSEDLLTDSTCVTTLRQIEGTVILHIMQAVKQNEELGSELLKYVKTLQQFNASKVISAFNLSLLLSVSQLHQFETQILDFLKSTILTCCRDEERQHSSLWVRECYTVSTKTEDLVLESVEHSTYDWDHVIQGLVKLGFSLMDSFGPKLVFGSMPESVSTNGRLTPTQQACQIGRRMLLKTFKAHEVVRTEILDQIFNQIVMKSMAPVTHYLDLLSDTVFSAPQLLLESTGKVQEILVKLTELPPQSADGLILALQPLLKLRPMLKDTLILVLRKALFSRQLASRKIGSTGFLMILKNFRVLGGLPSSQVSQPIALSQMVDVHSRYNVASNEALCLEILGNLRRCFTQQADIRLSMYQGLCDVLHRNSQLKNAVLDMLLAQLKKYYELNEDVCPPLRLEPCILSQGDQVFLVEPLGHMLKCVQECVRKVVTINARTRQLDGDDEDETGTSADMEKTSLKQLEGILSNLTKRIIDAEMEDFELDKNADFSLTNSVGVKNNIYAILLLGLYESLMEYSFETGNFSATSCKNVLDLFAKFKKLSTIVKEKSTSSAGKRGKSSAPKATNSLLSLDAIVHFLRAIIQDCSPDHQEGLCHLKENKEFFSYLVSVATQKLGQVASKGVSDGETQSKEKIFKNCCILGRFFHVYYAENQVPDESVNQLNKKLTSQCLEGLGLVVSVAHNSGLLEVLQCLTYLEKEPEDTEEQLVTEAEKWVKIHNHVKKIQRLMSTILSGDKEGQNWKEFSILLYMMEHLSSHLPSHSEEYHQVYDWVLKIATDETIEDATACKQLLSLLLKLGKQTKNFPQLLRSVCQDIHSQLGDIEEDNEVDERTHYAITKAASCPTAGILTLTITFLETELDDTEWAIRRHKAEMISNASADIDDRSTTQTETVDRFICTRLGVLVNGFIELTHSAVKTKPCAESLLKCLTKLYNALTSLTKCYINMYNNKAGHLGNRFEKLIALVGKQLTQPTYSMIIYVQMSETEQPVPSKKDKGKKKAGPSAQTGLAKAMKQMKTISNLIFSIEQLEKFLIQLTKKSKVDLMVHIKNSTSRDFRINSAAVHTVVEQGVSSDESDDDEGQGSENDGQGAQASSDSEQENHQPQEDPGKEMPPNEPPAKKRKSQLKKRTA